MTNNIIATLGDLGGQSVVVAYASAPAEYEALRTRAAVVDRSHRHRMRLRGPKAAEALTGLVTNDVLALEEGHGMYAAALTPKGKIVADVRIFRDADGLLVDAPRRAATAWAEMVRKYVNPRMAAHSDESAALRDVGIFGPQSRQIVSALTGAPASALAVVPPYGHVSVLLDGDPSRHVMAVHSRELGEEGYELIAPADLFDELWSRATEAGATPMGLAAWEIARIEAGRPEWGVDMDDATLPQEANLEELHAISYTKGCYVGQEVVARVHFRGHVNKLLRGIRATGSEPPPMGATLLDASGKTVGDVRSTAVSPVLGAIGLAMTRREVAPGSSLVATWDEDGVARELSVELLALPFYQVG